MARVVRMVIRHVARVNVMIVNRVEKIMLEGSAMTCLLKDQTNRILKKKNIQLKKISKSF